MSSYVNQKSMSCHGLSFHHVSQFYDPNVIHLITCIMASFWGFSFVMFKLENENAEIFSSFPTFRNVLMLPFVMHCLLPLILFLFSISFNCPGISAAYFLYCLYGIAAADSILLVKFSQPDWKSVCTTCHSGCIGSRQVCWSRKFIDWRQLFFSILLPQKSLCSPRKQSNYFSIFTHHNKLSEQIAFSVHYLQYFRE